MNVTSRKSKKTNQPFPIAKIGSREKHKASTIRKRKIKLPQQFSATRYFA